MSDAPERDGARRETIFRVVLTGTFLLAAAVWLIAGVFDVLLVSDNFTNSHSGSPGGHHAFVALLRENGREVRRSSTTLEIPEFDDYSGDTLMILEPRPEFMEEYPGELEGVLKDARSRSSSVLLALPKRSYHAAGEEGDDLVLHEYIFPPEFLDELAGHSGVNRWFRVEHDVRETVPVTFEAGSSGRTWDTRLSSPVQVLVPRSDLADLPPTVKVLAWTDRGDAVAVRLRVNEYERRGGLIVVSDPDVFSNRFLAEPGMAASALSLLDSAPPGGAIIIDEAMHGFGADASVEYLAATPPGLWVTLSVFAALLLYGWRQATVLRPREAETSDRAERRFAIEGLARMMQRVGDHNEAARRIVRRSRLVLGQGGAQVQGAGRSTTVIKGRTGKILRMSEGNSEERLVAVARRVAHQKRTGETEHSEVET